MAAEVCVLIDDADLAGKRLTQHLKNRNMPFQLRPASPSDVEDLVNIFFAAFKKDRVVSVTLPDVPTVRESRIEEFLRDSEDPSSHVMIVVDTDLPSEPIVACAQFEAPVAEKKQAAGPLYPPGGDEELAELFFTQLAERRAANMAGRRCWFLSLLVCHPDHEGRGAGSMLIRYSLALADREGADVYVEGSPAGAPVYKHFSLQEVGSMVLFEGKYVELLMLREASKIPKVP
ncbi:MAG: hypothetical protein M1818_002271 [Claussenomyces sp. TS43310]|nr:MAG: hypothetical protein M1818_002271 [Claussenomyces sp. TS43310]